MKLTLYIIFSLVLSFSNYQNSYAQNYVKLGTPNETSAQCNRPNLTTAPATPTAPSPNDQCQTDTDCPEWPDQCCLGSVDGKICKADCRAGVGRCTGITANDIGRCEFDHGIGQTYRAYGSDGHKVSWNYTFPLRTHNSSVTGDWSIMGLIPASSIMFIFERGTDMMLATQPSDLCFCTLSSCNGDNTPSFRFDGVGATAQENHLPLPAGYPSSVIGCDAPTPRQVYSACNMGPLTDFDSVELSVHNEISKRIGGTYGYFTPGETYCQSTSDTCRFTVNCKNGGTVEVETTCRQ